MKIPKYVIYNGTKYPIIETNIKNYEILDQDYREYLEAIREL